MAFIAPAISLVAAGFRSVGVMRAASCRPSSCSIVAFDFFIPSPMQNSLEKYVAFTSRLSSLHAKLQSKRFYRFAHGTGQQTFPENADVRVATSFGSIMRPPV